GRACLAGRDPRVRLVAHAGDPPVALLAEQLDPHAPLELDEEVVAVEPLALPPAAVVAPAVDDGEDAAGTAVAPRHRCPGRGAGAPLPGSGRRPGDGDGRAVRGERYRCWGHEQAHATSIAGVGPPPAPRYPDYLRVSSEQWAPIGRMRSPHRPHA